MMQEGVIGPIWMAFFLLVMVGMSRALGLQAKEGVRARNRYIYGCVLFGFFLVSVLWRYREMPSHILAGACSGIILAIPLAWWQRKWLGRNLKGAILVRGRPWSRRRMIFLGLAALGAFACLQKIMRDHSIPSAPLSVALVVSPLAGFVDGWCYLAKAEKRLRRPVCEASAPPA